MRGEYYLREIRGSVKLYRLGLGTQVRSASMEIGPSRYFRPFTPESSLENMESFLLTDTF